MAERPIFVPSCTSASVLEVNIQLRWHSGFAPIQKSKNISELHNNARSMGYTPLLEVSTKSPIELGRELSAFNLQVEVPSVGLVPLESAFQGSKVFAKGGPYSDLLVVPPREARKDDRLRSSGSLARFELQELVFPLEPKTAFYDWLYIGALIAHPELHSSLLEYSGFSDIEFNPQRSLNCQARSCALFVSLLRFGNLTLALRSPDDFISQVNYPAYALAS